MKRREFLRSSALATTSLWLPSFLPASLSGPVSGSRSGKILVVIQLSGGNDGLNTIVPYRNDIYYRSRPTLAISPEETIRASDELGFHPAMQGMQRLYDEGLLSIINSVGYPNPDRSHFRSMDIWHTGSSSNEYWNTGWLGRYLDSECTGGSTTPHHILELDDSLSLAIRGEERSGFAMSDPRRLKRTTDNPFLKAAAKQHDHGHEEQVDYLYKVMAETQSSADYLYEQSRVHRSTADYPRSEFGRRLRQVAELITADTATQVYYLSLSGFDTHANQKGRQERLLRQLADGLQAFTYDLKQHGLLEDTLIMAFSEFGRRVQQNASGGTDHGTANNLFLLGGKLQKPGFFNEAPGLAQLDEGDLRHQVDFRSVYSAILENWLEVERPEAILGKDFAPLAIV